MSLDDVARDLGGMAAGEVGRHPGGGDCRSARSRAQTISAAHPREQDDGQQDAEAAARGAPGKAGRARGLRGAGAEVRDPRGRSWRPGSAPGSARKKCLTPFLTRPPKTVADTFSAFSQKRTHPVLLGAETVVLERKAEDLRRMRSIPISAKSFLRATSICGFFDGHVNLNTSILSSICRASGLGIFFP